ncbi:MAG: single-stranded-DNA-specific exonuclease RecJ [Clostridia bacterium]|nr:single-stranded-DNA-specific exonuclease RecJ [Clostridia bacterium]
MNKKWQVYEVNEAQVEKIIQENNINKLIATILSNKGIIEKEDINKFLNPTRNDFHNPYNMPDMEKAVERIIKAKETGEKVIIYGDYDVDGITSITVLKSFLHDIGIEAAFYIPNRLNEGYGLNIPAVEKIASEGYNLMITVDCGISCIEEVKRANELGMEVIVTDHHEVGETLPNAVAVVDCKRKDNKYECRDLAGVGVAFKLAQALSMKLGLDEKEYLKYLDIVCIGTISDIVPLVDENRVISKLGLMLANQTRNIGLREIFKISGYKNIDSTAVSFGVAPRLNACGRMGHADEALKVFLSKDLNKVQELTILLNNYNKTRQDIEKNIYEDAIKQIEEKGIEQNRVIVVAGKDWHHGVIGIVSSKITEKYFKPSILLCLEDGIGKGSGRSIPGFDLHDALTKCQNTLDKFGGHAMAVGLSLKQENIENFTNQFEKIAEEQHIEEIMPELKIDAKVNLDEISKEMVQSLKMLEPFGEANKMPIFLFKNLRIDSIRALSDGKHLKLTLKDNNVIVNAIGFYMGALADEYRIGDKIDAVGTLEINSFNGVESIQINLKDIMKAI